MNTPSDLVADLERNGHEGLTFSQAKTLIKAFANKARDIISYYDTRKNNS